MRVLEVAVGLILFAGGCQREQRRFSEAPPANRLIGEPEIASKVLSSEHANLESYAKNAWAIGEGQRLFSQMNCSGCHAHGGGGMGPPLMDSGWRYGSDVESIEHTIADGRPNGMPAYRARMSPQQLWQMVAYVRSLSGNAPSAAAPVRDDHMAVRPPPSRTDPEPPVVEKVD